MGLSQSADPRESRPLPPQRIVDAFDFAGATALPAVDEDGYPVRFPAVQRTAPKEINVDKRRLPFVVVKDSIVVAERGGGNFQLEFSATATEEANVVISFYCDGNSNEDAVDLSAFRFTGTVARGTTERVIAGMPSGEIFVTKNGCVVITLTDIATGGMSSQLVLTVQPRIVDCRWVCSVTNSHAVVDGSKFSLVSLFGGSGAAGIDSVENKCVVCLAEFATVALLPCRHMCVCRECARATLESQNNMCPICRRSATGTLKISNS